MALPCAFVLRRFQVAADGTRRGSVELSGSVYEIALVILSAYMAYLVAEVLPHRSLELLPCTVPGTYTWDRGALA